MMNLQVATGSISFFLHTLPVEAAIVSRIRSPVSSNRMKDSSVNDCL